MLDSILIFHMTLFAHSKFDKGIFNLQDTHLYRRRIAKAILDDVHEGDPKGLREEFEAIVFVNSDCFYFHIAI